MSEAVKIVKDSIVKDYFADERLLFMLGEELRAQLSTTLLLADAQGSLSIKLQTQRALRTIDNVLLYRRLQREQQELQFAPVHVGAVLATVAQKMHGATKNQQCASEFAVQAGIATVDTDPLAFEAAITSLWQAVLHMVATPSTLKWQVKRSGAGIRLSITNETLLLRDFGIARASKKAGFSSQPFAAQSGSATDFLTARGLFDLLGGNVRKTHKQGVQGFGVTLAQSKQLSLIEWS